MSTTTTASRAGGLLRRQLQRIFNSNELITVFSMALIGGAILTILAGLAGLVVWVVTLLGLAFTGSVETVVEGWLFVVTAWALFVFDVP